MMKEQSDRPGNGAFACVWYAEETPFDARQSNGSPKRLAVLHTDMHMHGSNQLRRTTLQLLELQEVSVVGFCCMLADFDTSTHNSPIFET